MIPCHATCPRYYEGCHKTCPEWKERQQAFRSEQQAKTLWLKQQNEVCTTVLRQYRAMNPVQPFHY